MINWSNAYLDRDKDIFDHYEHEVKIPVRELALRDTIKMEKWCRENFGPLNESSVDSSWQVAVSFYKAKEHESFHECQICFLFHAREDAVAFKLAWV